MWCVVQIARLCCRVCVCVSNWQRLAFLRARADKSSAPLDTDPYCVGDDVLHANIRQDTRKRPRFPRVVLHPNIGIDSGWKRRHIKFIAGVGRTLHYLHAPRHSVPRQLVIHGSCGVDLGVLTIKLPSRTQGAQLAPNKSR